MAQLLKDGLVVEDSWQTIDSDLETLPATGDLLLTLAQWEQFAPQLPQYSGSIGILLDTDTELEDIPSQCLELPCSEPHTAILNLRGRKANSGCRVDH